jgi:hypothetical protein
VKSTSTGKRKEKLLRIYCSLAEYAIMQTQWEKSTSRSFSGYARQVLLGKPVIVTWRNASLDALISELNELRSQLEQAMTRDPPSIEISLANKILQMITIIANKISEQCMRE